MTATAKQIVKLARVSQWMAEPKHSGPARLWRFDTRRGFFEPEPPWPRAQPRIFLEEFLADRTR